MKHYFLSGILLLIAVGINSCSSDEEKDYTKVYSQEILSISPKDRILQLEKMNFKIHEGKEPPVISGVYKASPYMMANSTEENWNKSGERVEDYYYSFRNQASNQLAVQIDILGVNYENGNLVYKSIDETRYLSGKNDLFSAFSIVENYYTYRNNQDTARFKSLEIMSGKITPLGLEDYQFAFIMLDNYGNEFGKLMKNDAVRIFYDGDGIADISQMPSFEAGVDGRRFRPLERILD